MFFKKIVFKNQIQFSQFLYKVNLDALYQLKWI